MAGSDGDLPVTVREMRDYLNAAARRLREVLSGYSEDPGKAVRSLPLYELNEIGRVAQKIPNACSLGYPGGHHQSIGSGTTDEAELRTIVRLRAVDVKDLVSAVKAQIARYKDPTSGEGEDLEHIGKIDPVATITRLEAMRARGGITDGEAVEFLNKRLKQL